jgi:hypothetical protein
MGSWNVGGVNNYWKFVDADFDGLAMRGNEYLGKARENTKTNPRASKSEFPRLLCT